LKKNNQNKSFRGIECLNCKQPLNSGDCFCSNCGQKNDIRPLQLSQLLSEFFLSFFSLDSRFLRTIIPLISKPGKVTKEYSEGKRMSFMNPFRFYINISIFFFLIQGIFGFFDSFKEETDVNLSPKINKEIPLDSVSKKKVDSILVANNVDVKIDSARNNINLPSNFTFFKKIENSYKFYIKHRDLSVDDALDSLNYPATFSNKFIYKKASDVVKLKDDKNYQKKLANDINSKISIALFLMLPFFALFYKLFYIRRSFSYMEHLVFIFHTQSVFFMYLIFFFLFDRIFNTDIGILLLILTFGYYLFKAMKYFYNQNGFKTFLKYSLLVFVFFVLSIINITFVSIFSFATN
jgi:hypothetical protein